MSSLFLYSTIIFFFIVPNVQYIWTTIDKNNNNKKRGAIFYGCTCRNRQSTDPISSKKSNCCYFCYYLVVRRVSESQIKYEKHIPKQQATRTTDSLDYYSKCYQNIITSHLSILSQNPAAAMAIAIAGSWMLGLGPPLPMTYNSPCPSV